jgi:uncharacterized protein with von Willebrand factor type A (vWA) domain
MKNEGKEVEEDHIKKKGEFFFILDSSGSMEGEKMDRAKDALKVFLKDLPEDSFFNVVTFGDQHTFLDDKESLKKSEESYTRAEKAIDGF